MSADPVSPLPAMPPARSEPPSGVRVRGSADKGTLHVGLHGLLTLPLPQPEKWAHALRVSEQDAEDLIQDAVLALLEKPNERPRSPRGWLFGAARLGRRRLLRARARAAKYEPQVEAYLRDLGGPFPAPDEELDCRERLLAVFWLLDHVKPGRRAVAEHHLLGESSEEDIAAELGLVLGTVKSQWRRAKADMRAGLDREMAKNGDKAWLAGLFALVAALWLWVSRHVRRRPGRLLACAALSLAVSTDGASSAESVSRTDDATSSLRISLPSIAVFLPAWAEREAGAEGSAINLEHREELVRNPRIGLAIKAETRAKTTTSHQGDPLAKVREAMRRGDLEEAAMALRAYETNHPDPNANSLHRALRIALAERMHARQ